MSRRIRIVEVGPRDGLQNEPTHLSEAVRLQFIKMLSKTGLKNIEIGAFVSNSWVPQMAGTDKVARKVRGLQKRGQLSRSVSYSTLVPNLKGLESALEADVKEIAIFTAASESFTRKNINCSIKESLERFRSIKSALGNKNVKIRGYVSTAFYCPYEGKISLAKTIKVVNELIKLGCHEISIGDTIGAATPKDVRALLSKLKTTPKNKIAMHFHDTRGTALPNIIESLEHGIQIFDSSLGGLGGCPYAPGAAGNVATEDVVYLLENMGYKTGVDLKKLLKINKWMASKIGRPLPSRVGLAGLPKA